MDDRGKIEVEKCEYYELKCLSNDSKVLIKNLLFLNFDWLYRRLLSYILVQKYNTLALKNLYDFIMASCFSLFKFLLCKEKAIFFWMEEFIYLNGLS
jgi:hypothetical protein